MEAKIPWTHRKIFGFRIFEIVGVIALYLFFSFSYRLTLWINGEGYKNGILTLFDFSRYWDAGGLEYFVKFFLTIPIWFLVFRVLRNWSLPVRLSVHLVTLPLFVFVFQKSFYAISEYFDMWHLTGAAAVWDIYIPGLFYCIQFGIFHAYEYYRDNQRNMQLKAELSKAALKSELAAIKAQLNPHFLYNTFNSINASLPPEQEDTRELIAKLSDLFRYQLRGTKRDLVPLSEEVQFLETYLNLEKERFGERLSFRFEIEPGARKAMVPPMILQPLVENAIKHGIAPRVEGGSVTVAASISGGTLRIQIIDNGVGFSKDHTTQGVGLHNTILRLDKMYREDLHIDSHPDQGTTISFKIPLHEESTHRR